MFNTAAPEREAAEKKKGIVMRKIMHLIEKVNAQFDPMVLHYMLNSK